MDRLTLLPCPFCAGRAEIKVGIHTKYVMCLKCEVMGPNLIDEDELVAAWNRRQSLSQEAVRDEVLADAARYRWLQRHCHRMEKFAYMEMTDWNAEIDDALKREPNAAAQELRAGEGSLSVRNAGVGDQSPAPAAPVAEMVKRLNEGARHLRLYAGYRGEPDSTVLFELSKELTEAAAILAKLGQRWIPVHDEESKGGAFLTGIPGKPIYALDERGGPQLWYRFDLPPLPLPPGASDD